MGKLHLISSWLVNLGNCPLGFSGGFVQGHYTLHLLCSYFGARPVKIGLVLLPQIIFLLGNNRLALSLVSLAAKLLALHLNLILIQSLAPDSSNPI